MKQITIISGKGGTGKTSISASLIALAQESGIYTIAADCDVEAANLSFLLPGLPHYARDYYAGQTAIINKDVCTGCGACVRACRFNAISYQPGVSIPIINPIQCEGCELCRHVCPADAIDFKKNRAGMIYADTINNGRLIRSEIGIAQDNSGKLVTNVRLHARIHAQDSHAEYIINDGPPGIGCPLNSSIINTDYIVIVVEPTPTALHDCIRLLTLLKKQQIKHGIIINKSDISNQLSHSIEEKAAEYSIPIIGKLPFSIQAAKALAQKQLLHTIPEFKQPMYDIWKTIRTYI